jgi:hypothetical protein
MPEISSQPDYLRKQMDRYRSEIPAQLWDILLSKEGDDPEEFVTALKRLRIREQERDYVMAIQRNFRIPIRPQESVKESMSRARARILSRQRNGSNRFRTRRLPLDPLE